MLHTNVPQQGSLLINGQNSVSSSTLDRNMGRNSNTSNRLTPKHNPTFVETNDETLNHRTLKKTDSNECIIDSSPQQIHSAARTSNDKEHRLSTTIQNKGPAPISPKPTTPAWRKSLLVISNEQESNSIIPDPIYGNVQTSPNTINRELSFENEGDLIEHDLLDLVEQEKQKEEQQRNTPPALPIKTRTGSLTATKDNNNLDFDIEPTTKLTHP
ncbi:unnamed protein product, partial [Rotaria magnacalcarata]